MITKILIPTDFSKASINALKYAIQLAKKTKSEICLLNVADIPMADAYVTENFYISYMNEIKVNAEEKMKKVVQKYLKGKDVKFKSVVITGFAISIITSYAEDNKIDLIVMGTTGASGLSEILMGSTTSNLIARSKVPVLAVPSKAKFRNLETIVYATDFQEPEFPAVSRLIYLAELFQARLFVLHAKSGRKPLFGAEHNFFVRNRQNISYKNWDMVTIGDPDVIDGINDFAEEVAADMIVMAKHNRSFFQKIFHRSLSKHMACHTEIPLLVLSKEERSVVS